MFTGFLLRTGTKLVAGTKKKKRKKPLHTHMLHMHTQFGTDITEMSKQRWEEHNTKAYNQHSKPDHKSSMNKNGLLCVLLCGV